MLNLPHCIDNMCCGCDSRWDQLVDVAICATLAPGLCGRPKEMLTEKLSSEYKLRLSGTHAHTIEHSYHVHRHEHSHTHAAQSSQLSTAVMISQLHYNSNNTTTQTFAGNFKYIGVRVFYKMQLSHLH